MSDSKRGKRSRSTPKSEKQSKVDVASSVGRKRRPKKSDENKEGKHSSRDSKSGHEARTNKESVLKDVGTVKADGKAEHEFSPETKKAAKEFFQQVKKYGFHHLRLQYNEIRLIPITQPSTAGTQAVELCRYKDVPCFDYNRVVLKDGEQNNFIHANIVDFPGLLLASIICTQGPIQATVPDFWRMCRQIIMLCNCVEMGKPKCFQYWPSEAGAVLEAGKFTITCTEKERKEKHFVISKLKVKLGSDTWSVTHRQWENWPDKSVPETPLAPYRLLEYARKGTTVVHCSAGVGRTGTLVALELIYRTLKKGEVPDVKAIVTELRTKRSHSVQTEDQYLYLFYATMQLLRFKAKDHIEISFLKRFVELYKVYLQKLLANGGKYLPLEATAEDWEETVRNKKKEDKPEDASPAPESTSPVSPLVVAVPTAGEESRPADDDYDKKPEKPADDKTEKRKKSKPKHDDEAKHEKKHDHHDSKKESKREKHDNHESKKEAKRESKWERKPELKHEDKEKDADDSKKRHKHSDAKKEHKEKVEAPDVYHKPKETMEPSSSVPEPQEAPKCHSPVHAHSPPKQARAAPVAAASAPAHHAPAAPAAPVQPAPASPAPAQHAPATPAGPAQHPPAAPQPAQPVPAAASPVAPPSVACGAFGAAANQSGYAQPTRPSTPPPPPPPPPKAEPKPEEHPKIIYHKPAGYTKVLAGSVPRFVPVVNPPPQDKNPPK
ncbi:unnamed protein product [Bursaphelenchus okinawaensis]|uniref:Tyrosine phosphatase n=1 Tax=Bursaphelenchus okinawaensis TaxID=465554 RepID=A0A811JTU9_9BILA|nr:unnamed protein product [Bursaphelenchus okinawaensis]CAG9082221.1 unnamed protein product [Bursaphelenchus okinawaensis]